MKVVSTERVPIKLWLDDIEDGALDQARNLANLPFIFKHVAVMPDAHQGYGMPIGGVMATKGVIIPNAVGVDIGCGMCAVNLGEVELPVEKLKKIMGGIRQAVPVGFKKHSKNQIGMPDGYIGGSDNLPVIHREYSNAQKSLGTLGGGNHFIEVQKDNATNHVWVMIHSGSRNLGLQVAKHYNKLAIEINERYHSQVLKAWQLAFLPIDSEEGTFYRAEMEHCIAFALANRDLMMKRVLAVVEDVTGVTTTNLPIINIAHNYATMEHHFGENVMVHRKGATKAYLGQLGIIPGSQGSKSYIVRGRGHELSFKSCSHGAGRRMSRTAAIKGVDDDGKKLLDLEEQQELLNSMGVIHSVRGAKDLDEAPGAYKDIGKVMANQTELVDIVVELSPLAVIKG